MVVLNHNSTLIKHIAYSNHIFYIIEINQLIKCQEIPIRKSLIAK